MQFYGKNDPSFLLFFFLTDQKLPHWCPQMIWNCICICEDTDVLCVCIGRVENGIVS